MVSPFVSALKHKDKNLARLSSQSKKIIGYFCTYTPIEIIHASGFIPVRILGEARRIDKADALVPNFICPYMRLALEKGMSGEYSYISGLVQAYTCDVTCGVMNIWKENIGGEIFYTMPLPYFDGPDSRDLFRSLIMELAERLDAIGGTFSEKSLEGSIALYDRIRERLLHLYELRYRGALPLSARDLFYVVQAGFVTRPEDYLKLLEDLLEEIKVAGDRDRPRPGGAPVLVSGSVLDSPDIYDIIEQSGGRIVADDLCTGFRHIYPPSGAGGDPVGVLIDRYLRRFPCPSRSRASDRLPEIKKLIASSGAKGVIFIFQKFCMSHLADQPVLAEELKKENIQSILIEIEENGISEGQTRTRLEAFFEMVG